jgi:hypothetical protein
MNDLARKEPGPQASPDGTAARDLPALVAVIRRRNRLLTIVTVALVLYAAYAARTLVVPIVFSVLVSLVLAPAVRLLVGWRFPRLLATTLGDVGHDRGGGRPVRRAERPRAGMDRARTGRDRAPGSRSAGPPPSAARRDQGHRDADEPGRVQGDGADRAA